MALIPTLAIGSSKGGVGKTYIAVSLAVELAAGGDQRPPLRVLLVDLDPQGNATYHLTQTTIDQIITPSPQSHHMRWISALSDGRSTANYILNGGKAANIDHGRLGVLPGGTGLARLEGLLGDDLHAVTIWQPFVDAAASVLGSDRSVASIVDEMDIEEAHKRILRSAGPDLIRRIVSERLRVPFETNIGPTTMDRVRSVSAIANDPQIARQYDLIIIDTPPTRSNLLAQAIQASTHYAVIIDPSDVGYSGAEMVIAEAQAIAEIELQSGGVSRQFIGAIVNKYLGDKPAASKRADIEFMKAIAGEGMRFSGAIIDPPLPYDGSQMTRNTGGMRSVGRAVAGLFRRQSKSKTSLRLAMENLTTSIHQIIYGVEQ